MKKMNVFVPISTMGIGMALGAYMHAYKKNHPVKVQMAKNKIEDMVKDLM